MNRQIHLLVMFVVAAVLQTACRSTSAQETFQGTRAEALEVVLDDSAAKERRLLAARRLDFPKEDESEELLKLARDTDTDEDVRQMIILIHGTRPVVIDLMLDILDDPDNGSERLNVFCIDHLNRFFQIREQSPVWQRTLGSLRNLLDDQRQAVRTEAFDVLVPRNDPVAVEKLTAGLKRETETPLPVDQSIALLNLANPVRHLAVIRPYLHDSDSQVVAQAVRALSVDPQSRGEIVDMATSGEANLDVRLAAIESLSLTDDDFADYAIGLIENPQESPLIRRSAIHSMAAFLNQDHDLSAQQQAQLYRILQRIGGKEKPSFNSVEAEAQGAQWLLWDKYPDIRRSVEPPPDAGAAALDFADAALPVAARIQSLERIEKQDSFPLAQMQTLIADDDADQSLRIVALRTVVRKLNKGQEVPDAELQQLTALTQSIAEGPGPDKLKEYAQRVSKWLRDKYSS